MMSKSHRSHKLRHSKVSDMSSVLGEGTMAHVTGKDRYRFFDRPVIPHLSSAPPLVVLAPVDRDEKREEDVEVVNEGPRTIGIQTDYREQETQTDPYTPHYKPLPPGAPKPEVLSIKHMKFGQGLPVGMEEVKEIQRIREKRKFEESLPPLTDEASFQLRKKLMEEQELKEWNIRAQEMKEEQEERLKMFVAQLRQREEKQQAKFQRRVERLKKTRIKEKNSKLEGIQRERVKVFRKLGRITLPTEKKTKGRDIVSDYADPSSKAYAPVHRDGSMPSRTQVVDYGIPAIQNLTELNQLEDNFPQNVSRTRVKVPTKIIPKTLSNRKGQKMVADLAHVEKVLRAAKEDLHKTEPEVQNVYKKFEPVVRPPTPSVEPVDDTEDKAALLMQRLLRGRTVQSQMAEGKENFLALIRELRLEEKKDSIVEVVAPPHRAVDFASLALDIVQGHILSHILCSGGALPSSSMDSLESKTKVTDEDGDNEEEEEDNFASTRNMVSGLMSEYVLPEVEKRKSGKQG